MHRKIISSIILLLFSLIFYKCSDPVSVSQDIPLETLLSAPETLNIENQTIILNTALSRDFMPISPPDGKPLGGSIYISTIDSTLISSSIFAISIYIVNKDQIWKSFINGKDPIEIKSQPFRIKISFHNGPKWTPRIYVDVIVRIKVKEKYFLLRASKQYIQRTD